MFDLDMKVQTAFTSVVFLTAGIGAYMRTVDFLCCPAVMLLSTIGSVLIELGIILVIEGLVFNDSIKDVTSLLTQF